MTAQTLDLAAVVTRLEKVERQNWRMKVGGILALLVAGAGLLMGQAMPRATTVEAEAFIVRDATGRQRAALHLVPDGGVALSFFDPAGVGRAALRIDREGSPDLTLIDQSAKNRAVLRVERNGAPGLALFDQAGNPRAALHVVLDGSGLLQLSNKDEKLYTRVP
ncbi:MAG TPA: hypothetical protein VLM91_24085 [Candidatus Methylomirabilis sp.]|nr:hypothetical protein [Candidatus Methylomirabilis sp.]